MFIIPVLGEFNPEDIKVITQIIQDSVTDILNQLSNSSNNFTQVINEGKSDIINTINATNPTVDEITKNQFFILSLGIALSTYVSTSLSQIRTSIITFQNKLNTFEINPKNYDRKRNRQKKWSLIGLIICDFIIWIAVLFPALTSIVHWEVDTVQKFLFLPLNTWIKFAAIFGSVAMLFMHIQQWWICFTIFKSKTITKEEYKTDYKDNKKDVEKEHLEKQNELIEVITKVVTINFSQYLNDNIQAIVQAMDSRLEHTEKSQDDSHND